jgi:membrane protease YdiL (CAAX protease family)
LLFYVKRYLALEVAVTILLGGLGLWGIRYEGLSFNLRPTTRSVVLGIAGFVWLAVWTRLVQYSYQVVKGSSYARSLTASLAKEFADARPVQMVLGGLTAACGEEIFFRGFIQSRWGLLLASLLFMAAHIGKKEIRIISYWSFFQGLYLGLFYMFTAKLLVPMIAHGLFDIGGMIYFRDFMTRSEKPA